MSVVHKRVYKIQSVCSKHDPRAGSDNVVFNIAHLSPRNEIVVGDRFVVGRIRPKEQFCYRDSTLSPVSPPPVAIALTVGSVARIDGAARLGACSPIAALGTDSDRLRRGTEVEKLGNKLPRRPFLWDTAHTDMKRHLARNRLRVGHRHVEGRKGRSQHPLGRPADLRGDQQI